MAFNEFTGREFPKEEPNGKLKTMALNKILVKVEECLLINSSASFDEHKNALVLLITGNEPKHNSNRHKEEFKKVKVFADYVEDFMETKIKKGKKSLYKITASELPLNL